MLNEYLWYNYKIKIGEQTVYYKSWNKAGINFIHDIFNFNSGTYKTKEELENKFNIPIKAMEYNSLVSAIPSPWSHCIKNSGVRGVVKKDHLIVKLDKVYKNVSDLKCRDYYSYIICKKKSTPTCISRREILYNDMKFDWSGIYSCAFQNTRETILQSFQYKVLNRFVPCNANLFKWKKADTKLCTYCGSVDTIEHFLYECNSTKCLWDTFFDWWYAALKTNIHCSMIDIIFGIANPENNIIIKVLNFCIIFVKYFVYCTKVNSQVLNLTRLKCGLKYRILCEKCILFQQNNCKEYYEVWHPLLQGL